MVDYDNTFDDIPIDLIYSASTDFKRIARQSSLYLLHNITHERYIHIICSSIMKKLNKITQFSFIDKTHSIININFFCEHEHEPYDLHELENKEENKPLKV